MPDLPRELVEAIVDAVEDPECLKLCSLASSQFLAPCQRILCPTISISQNCGVNLSIHQVFETITESPHLALYIRELTVFLLHLEDDHTPLLGIIQAVTNAECLIIRGSPHSGTFISSDLIPSILNVLTRPVFRRLHLMHLYHVQPSFMLRALSSTRAVLLRGVGVDVNPADTEYTDEPSGYPPSRLEDLTILARVRRPNDMVNIFDLITGDKMLRHLQRLQRLVLEVNLGANQARCARIFAAVSETLQHLDIHCGDNDRRSPPTSVALPHLPALQSIQLRIFLYFHPVISDVALNTVASLPSAAPNLQKLRLLFTFATPERHYTLPPGRQIVPFDSATGYRAQLPHLRSVECRLLVRPADAERPQHILDAAFTTFVDTMEAAMPGIRGTEALIFSRGVSITASEVREPW